MALTVGPCEAVRDGCPGGDGGEALGPTPAMAVEKQIP
jgi:hypothetical protein